jgi:ATP-dependent helicase/nuclease subunit B
MLISEPGRLTRIAAAPHGLLATAARRIVEDAREQLPDLTHVVVLVPDLHVSGELARILREMAGCSALLLPRITTLAQCAGEVALDQPVLSYAARESLLYRELAGRGWLAGADLWAVSAELCALFDELTRWNVGLPASLADFTRRLESAYRTKSSASLSFEARLVHELWHVVSGGITELDPGAALLRRLALLAQQAKAPLYVLGLGRLPSAESGFVASYAQRAPVTLFEADHTLASDPVARTLRAAWPDRPGQALTSRAADLRSVVADSPFAGRLRIIAVQNAEAEAQAIDAVVRAWLAAGRQRVAVVVQDRVVARRARALLERAQVLVKDDAGWAYSTTSAATAIGRLLDVVSNDAYHRDLLDLMKSPFAFHDMARRERQGAVWRLEQSVRRTNAISGLNTFLSLALNDAQLRSMLERVAGASREFTRRRNTLAGWLGALHRALSAVGIAGGLQADAAGTELLDLLDDLAGELAADRLQVSFGEWRRWLGRKLEGATFHDAAIASPVVFTYLAALRLRLFDQVVIAGGDAAHLPGPDTLPMFFNQGVRAELGLPTRAEDLREIEEQLAEIVAASDSVAVTWQRTSEGEDNLLSPFFERLETLHRCAWSISLLDGAFPDRANVPVPLPDAVALPGPTTQPRPVPPALLIPSSISASAYNTLVACPYRFHAHYILGLRELDDVQEELEKSGYGLRVHESLARFHREHPVLGALGRAAAIDALERYSESAFHDVVATNYLDVAWLARWKALIPDYVDWHLAREAQGWRFEGGEIRREVAIVTPGGRRLVLRGQLDRVDVQADSHGVTRAVAVIDYKTRSRKALQDALDLPGEDVQLPVYAMLWGGPVAAMLFLSIDRDGVEGVAPAEDVSFLARAAAERLAACYDALHEGAALPAQGTDAACEYCDAGGLCRRKFWP